MAESTQVITHFLGLQCFMRICFHIIWIYCFMYLDCADYTFWGSTIFFKTPTKDRDLGQFIMIRLIQHFVCVYFCTTRHTHNVLYHLYIYCYITNWISQSKLLSVLRKRWVNYIWFEWNNMTESMLLIFDRTCNTFITLFHSFRFCLLSLSKPYPSL